jgi:hypothetical protein
LKLQHLAVKAEMLLSVGIQALHALSWQQCVRQPNISCCLNFFSELEAGFEYTAEVRQQLDVLLVRRLSAIAIAADVHSMLPMHAMPSCAADKPTAATCCHR